MSVADIRDGERQVNASLKACFEVFYETQRTLQTLSGYIKRDPATILTHSASNVCSRITALVELGNGICEDALMDTLSFTNRLDENQTAPVAEMEAFLYTLRRRASNLHTAMHEAECVLRDHQIGLDPHITGTVYAVRRSMHEMTTTVQRVVALVRTIALYHTITKKPEN